MLSACCLLIMKGSVQTNIAPPKNKAHHNFIVIYEKKSRNCRKSRNPSVDYFCCCITFLETRGNSVLVSDWEKILYSLLSESQQSQHILLLYSRIYKIRISRSTATKNKLFCFVIYDFAYVLSILLSRSLCFVVKWAMESSFGAGYFTNIYVSNHSCENALHLTAVKH